METCDLFYTKLCKTTGGKTQKLLKTIIKFAVNRFYMQEYKISEPEVTRILWRMRVLLPLFAVCFCLASLALYYLMGATAGSGNYIVPVVIIAVTIAMIIVWRYMLKNNVEYFGSYRLVFTDEAITEVAMHRPENSIGRGKIGAITTESDGTIVIIARSGRKHIRIHKHIENRDALLAELNLIRPVVSAPSGTSGSALRIAATLVFLACGAIAAFSENEKVIMICGTVTAGLIAAGCIFIIVTRNADGKLKRLAKIALVVMTLGIVATLLLKLLLPHQ